MPPSTATDTRENGLFTVNTGSRESLGGSELRADAAQVTREVPVDPPASRLRRFLEGAPKAELHVHLRGAMPPEFFAGLLEKYTPAKALEDAPKRFLDAFQECDNIRPFLHSPLKAPIQSLFSLPIV